MDRIEELAEHPNYIVSECADSIYYASLGFYPALVRDMESVVSTINSIIELGGSHESFEFMLAKARELMSIPANQITPGEIVYDGTNYDELDKFMFGNTDILKRNGEINFPITIKRYEDGYLEIKPTCTT